MHAIELERSFNPKHFEDRIYAQWREAQAFMPAGDSSKTPFVVVIPPPNVTGVLHLGHGLVITLIDCAIRFHRMRAEPTLWLPGTDHAGIATQNVVEKQLKARSLSRHDLGRERFIEETWKVKAEHHKIICEQLARMGASVDWSRERFTLDEGLSQAVREVFVSLYERDLLYKGNYLVNWCTSCSTALSDDEVDYEEQSGTMYRIRYPRIDGEGFIEIATTRPETMFGDTAVAVHPEDERYRKLVGKLVQLPLTDRQIPIIADPLVERSLGSGALKITPAHALDDWEIAGRHSLELINILSADGRLNDAVPEQYRGLKVQEAREKTVAALKEGGFYAGEETITHALGHCYRCGTVIEPFLSEQWFVRMRPLADKALAAWQRGEIVFYPRKWEHTYQHWLENIRDWCISRQIWWGHRIPAWTCKQCGKLIVARTDPEYCPHCSSTDLVQDPDVLDTWFSSWLWPFSTLGWPNKTPDFAAFYPTTTLVTAYDIIFFWVARMIMAGLEFTGQVPFHNIYIHGLLRDEKGRKMSKSLGNGIDPLDIVEEFGADALKFTLAFQCAQGQDILLERKAFSIGSKFANKIWNASRYILMNLEGRTMVAEPALLPVDSWIYARLNRSVKTMTEAFLSYRYNDAAAAAYEYFWSDFCDWYLEATKLSFKTGNDAEKDRATTVLLAVLAESLRLLHPLLPFITEEIYHKLPQVTGLLITASYPVYDINREAQELEASFAGIQELVRLVRTVRAESGITPEKRLRVQVAGKDLSSNAELIKLLAGIGTLSFTPAETVKPAGSIGLVGTGFEAFVFLTEAVDRNIIIQKFTKELEKDKKFIAGLETKLANTAFLKAAPQDLVAKERQKLEDAKVKAGKVHVYLQDLMA
ncbi:MAG: valine--tRNA ligase [Spirochaetaceae bacterium]|jgi:valyl-tRNA synthetase|nr:valine--tRNA ligase [Spirochaetaceae bacterium]